MALATVDDIVAGLASKQTQPLQKVSGPPKGGGAFQSQWGVAGRPGAGNNPPVYTNGSGYACSSATTGAIAYTNGAVQNWLAKMMVMSSQQGVWILADRLWSCSGMGFAAGTYAVTTPGSLPARITDSGVGCELWVENFSACGVATGTLTANYLNTAAEAKAGVIGAVVSAPVLGQMQPVPVQVGDVGISQLTSVVTSQTWTSGTFGMTILKRIAEIEIGSSNSGTTLDWSRLGIPKILNDACLMMFFLAYSVTAPSWFGRLDIIDK